MIIICAHSCFRDDTAWCELTKEIQPRVRIWQRSIGFGCCGCPRGTKHPASIRVSSQENGAIGGVNDRGSGYIDSITFMTWLKHFAAIAGCTKGDTHILLLDGHESHTPWRRSTSLGSMASYYLHFLRIAHTGSSHST